MKAIRKAGVSFLSAAGLSVLLMASTNPVLADGGGRRGCGHDGHHYNDRHHKHDHHYRHRHHRRHHHRRHVVADYPRRPVYRSRNRGYAYPLTTYSNVTYQQPVYATGGTYAAGAGGNTPNFGNALGGALGGYLGSKIGKGSGQLAATAAGAVIGYSLGGQVGAHY